MTLTSTETTLIEALLCMFALNIVLNHSISNEICFNVSNAPLKMIQIIC